MRRAKILVGLCFLVLIASVVGQEAALLRSGAAYPDGAEDIFVAKRGRVLLTREAGSGVFTKWDTRSGLELGMLAKPDGDPFELTGPPTLSDERRRLLVPAQSGLWVLDLETLEWRHQFEFEGPNAACWDEKNRRYIVSRNQGRRNHLYTIDTASGEVTEVARLRGADRTNLEPRFETLSFTPKGKLLGIQQYPTEFLLVDPETWLVARNLRPERRAERMSPMPDGSIACFSQNYNNGRDFLEVFEKMDPETFEVTQSYSAYVPGTRSRSFTFNVPRNFDAAGNRILVQTQKELVWLDADTFEALEKIPVSDIGKGYDAALAVAWDERSRKIVLFADRELLTVDPEDRSVSQTFGYLPLLGGVTPVGGSVTDFVTGKQRVVSVQDGHISVSEWNAGDTILALSPDGQHAVLPEPATGGVRTREKGQGIAYSGRYGQGLKFAYPSSDYFQKRALEHPKAVVYSADGKRLLVMKDFASGVYAVSPGSESLLEIASFGLGVGRGFFEGAAFSADGSKVVFLLREDLLDKGNVHFLAVYDLASKKRLYTQELEANSRLLGFEPGGEIVTVGPKAQTLDYRSLETGSVTRSFETGFAEAADGSAKVRGFSSGDGRHFVVARGREALVAEAASGRQMGGALTLQDEGADLALLLDGRILAVSGKGIALMDTWSGEALGTLSLFDADTEWVFHREDGRFDATIAAQERMYFQQGDLVLPLASLFEETFTGDLLAGLLAGRRYPKPDLTVVASAPEVRLALAGQTRGLLVEDDEEEELIDAIPTVSSESIRLRVEAMSDSSLVEEIRIFHNGKRLQSSTRGLYVDDDIPEGDKKVEEIDVLLIPGENVFRAIALNGLRIESVPAELSIVYDRPGKNSGEGVKLHLVVVGVNQYDNPKYNLNYAVTDATAFKSEMEQRNAGLFSEVSATLLLDEEVSRGSIITTLQTISLNAGPRDVFIFYYAGHGVMSEGLDSEFFLVPPQVTQLYGDTGQLGEKGVSATMLRDMARQIRAQKQVFILDACHSAGALQTVAMRGAAEERAIALLARSTGTHWLTATGSDQFAAEFADLGHGAFTKAVLEGLDGGADSGEDGQVTVKELDAFLQKRVPELTREFRGAPQYPASFGYGQDFPVGVVAKP